MLNMISRGYNRLSSLAAMAILGAFGRSESVRAPVIAPYSTEGRKAVRRTTGLTYQRQSFRQRVRGTTQADLDAIAKAEAKRQRKARIRMQNEARMQASRLMQMEATGYTWPQLVKEFMKYHPQFASGRPFQLLDAKIYELGKEKRFRPQGLTGSLYQAAAEVHIDLAREADQKQAA